MSILKILDKIKKEVGDLVEEVAKQAVKPEEKPEPAVKPNTTAIPGHTGFVVGGGGNAPSASYEEEASWYETVPEEECQYNYDGPYLDYFKKIFAEEFPEYKAPMKTINEWRRYQFTFLKDASEKLVVELMTEKSAANSLRRECLKAGIPYVRFYFDHEGWWNTRAYVVKRIKEALGV
ncbi:MAG: hypothetical protein J5772_01595 [Clostridia bacterium]|nr:hypothetical protein [Clostridia bacterium]